MAQWTKPGRACRNEVMTMTMHWGFLFKGISDDQKKMITNVARELPMKEGEEIFSEGGEAKRLYSLKSGEVELLSKVNDLVELPIAILRNPGNVFGTGVLVEPNIYALTGRCAKSGTLLTIEDTALKELMIMDRDLGCIVMTNLAGQYLRRLKESRQEIKTHFKTLLKSYRG